MATPNPLGLKKPEDMHWLAGRLISLAAFLLPLFAVMTLGYEIGNGWTAMTFGTLWAAIFAVTVIRFVRKRTFLVVERFGYFWDVKFAGMRMVIPLIDNVILRDDFLQKSVDLYQGDIEIDFTDASAPVRASAWYQIGNPKDLDDGEFDFVRNDVLTYTYRVRANERAARIAELFQGALRPLLEEKSLSEVQKAGEDLAAKGTDDARQALQEIGVYPFPGKGIIIADIDLPQKVIDLREQQLQGEVEAAAAISRSRGYWEPVSQMKNRLEEKGMHMSDIEIVDFFLKLRGFETIEKTGSNISFIAPDIPGVLRTIGVGSVGSDKKVVTGASVASAVGGVR